MTTQPRPEQIHRAGVLARRNAKQFFNDAKALMAAKSYGHAYGMMVLAEEEAAKALIFHGLADGLLRNPEWLALATRKHEAKHATVAVTVMMRLMLFFMFGLAPHESMRAKRKRWLREGTVPGSIQIFYRNFQQAAQDIPGTIETIADMLEELSQLGQLQGRREKGFFVDLNESGEASGPHQFSLADCRKQMRLVAARLAAADDWMGSPKISFRRRVSLTNVDAHTRSKIASLEAFLFGQKGKNAVLEWLSSDSPKDLVKQIREFAADESKVAKVRSVVEQMQAQLPAI
ncbi:MAG TPA: AbiV family abortive infection protein [Burkholderiales bacterium]|nr:AbiV family abortive infection protein [Burkholderiales bacterium]